MSMVSRLCANQLLNITLMAILLNIGCKSNVMLESENEGEIIDVQACSYISDLSTILTAPNFIQLETNDKSLIGEISRIEVLNDTLLILDLINNKLLTFDFSGNFIRQIGQIGNGPNEYNKISSFYIVPERSEIVIWDNYRFQLMRFNLSGECLSKMRVNAYCHHLIENDDKIYAYLNNIPFYNEKDFPYNLLVLNPGGEVVAKGMPISSDQDAWYSVKHNLYKDMNGINFIDFYKGKVYNIQGDSIKLKYNITFGKKLPEEYIKNMDVFTQHKNDYAFLHTFLIENQKCLVFNYAEQGTMKMGFYNFNLKEVKVFNMNNVNIIDMIFEPMCYYKNDYISVLDQERLVPLKPFVEKLKVDSNYKQIIIESDPAKNPVLALQSLK